MEERNLRILYISHSWNTKEGSLRSLGYILRNTNFRYDFLYMSGIRRKKNLPEGYVGKNCENVYTAILPVRADLLWPGLLKKRLKSIYDTLIRIPWIVGGYIKINCLAKKRNYDYIQINSLSLFPLISRRHKYVLHVREIITAKGYIKRNIIKKMQKAEKIIFIGPETFCPFQDISLPTYLILQNPVDMRAVAKVRRESCPYPLEDETIVISLLGSVDKAKGVLFSIEAFKACDREDLRLWIFPNLEVDTPYFQDCIRAAQEDKRIRFFKPTNRVEDVYFASDYVLRGDEVTGIGRTTLEGLFAGCDVILPGTTEENERLLNQEMFSGRIHGYSLGDKDALSAMFACIQKIDKKKRSPIANLEAYIETYETFMKE